MTGKTNDNKDSSEAINKQNYYFKQTIYKIKRIQVWKYFEKHFFEGYFKTQRNIFKVTFKRS